MVTSAMSSQTYEANNPKAEMPVEEDLQLNSAEKVQAQIVDKPNFLVRTFRYIADNPVEFLLSTASSIAIRASLVAVFGTSIAAAVGVAMATSIILSVGKQVLFDSKPSADDLGEAQNAEIAGGVFSTTLKRALISGAIAGLLGVVLGPLADTLNIKEMVSGSDAVVNSPSEPIAHYSPDEGVVKELEAMRPKYIAAVEAPKDEIYTQWRGQPLRLDDAIVRDYTQVVNTGSRVSPIADGIGFDSQDAQHIKETLFKDATQRVLPDGILDAAQREIFAGKTFLIDAEHYRMVADGSSRYDLGAVVDAKGAPVLAGLPLDEQCIEVINGKKFEAIPNLFDAKGAPYTYKTFGPAFTAQGTPVAIEAHVNVRSAIEFGQQAEKLGADVIYSNLGRATESAEVIYQKMLAAGHAPDMVVSFNADATADSARFNVTQGDDTMPVPVMQVHSADLSNSADNLLARHYPYERTPEILRGVGDYFQEHECGVNFISPTIAASAVAENTVVQTQIATPFGKIDLSDPESATSPDSPAELNRSEKLIEPIATPQIELLPTIKPTNLPDINVPPAPIESAPEIAPQLDNLAERYGTQPSGATHAEKIEPRTPEDLLQKYGSRSDSLETKSFQDRLSNEATDEKARGY